MPLVLKKDITGQNERNQPANMIAQASTVLHNGGLKWRQVSHLSSHNEAKTNRTTMPKKMTRAIGIIRILRLIPPVATL